MKLIDIVDYDISNYKKPSMFLIFPKCSFKCGRAECQNYALAHCEHIEIDIRKIIDLYEKNPLTQAIVCGGLEPMDSWEELQNFISLFRYWYPDEIVIYTGYTEKELEDKIKWLSLYENIIIKFGRYLPNEQPHYDEILGVNLASNNQYAKIYNSLEEYEEINEVEYENNN